ncbi:hypothetical protein, partial [Arthrobacter sp. Hiyo1]|uniref:hypothetical protein n=1 Tax=Arthrobacter sp. Hiyo1 TaxID=1588020 RepID=UPI0040402C3C
MDIGVDDSHAQPLRCKGARKVDRHGGLAYTALAAGHGEDLRQGTRLVERYSALPACASQLFLEGIALRLCHDLELDIDGGHAGNPRQGGGGVGRY